VGTLTDQLGQASFQDQLVVVGPELIDLNRRIRRIGGVFIHDPVLGDACLGVLAELDFSISSYPTARSAVADGYMIVVWPLGTAVHNLVTTGTDGGGSSLTVSYTITVN
jgi:hypothetical protein